jgi:hypothetical protein
VTIDQATAPIIVFGAPRSGTTYLNRILNEHPDVNITEESRVFVWMYRSLMVLPRREEALCAHREQFLEHLRSQLPEVVRSFYRELDPAARHWGDKNPHYASERNAGCLDTIAEVFPDARFVHIIRDGRDVVNSLLRKRWADFEDAHQTWKQHVRIGCDFGRVQPPGSYCEIRYEDLVSDDLEVAGGVFAFLGLVMDPRVKVFCQQQQTWRTPLSDPERNLNAGGQGSDWRRTLSPDQQMRSLDLLEPRLLALGYETEGSASRVELGAVKIHLQCCVTLNIRERSTTWSKSYPRMFRSTRHCSS